MANLWICQFQWFRDAGRGPEARLKVSGHLNV